MNNLNYILYARKSSEAKEKQALSISDQILECNKYANREKLKVVKIFKESKSAYKPRNRPDFEEMVALIESGQADAILTWHPNRLCRNPEEGGKLLQLLQDGVIKEIRTTADDVYSPESDHLVLQIHFGMANQYSRDISRNVKRSLRHKAERGEYPRPAIVGYNAIGERGKKNLNPNSFEAPLIKEAFELAETGKYSLGYFEDTFFDKGLRTKRGKKISKSHWHHIFTNQIYYGYFYHDGELYKGSYKPIISKSLYDKVQKALQNRSKPRTQSWDNPYNGLIKCPECGCAVTTTVKVKSYNRTKRTAIYTYLHCTRRKGDCTQPTITLDDFETDLVEKLSKISIDEDVWNLGIKLLKQKHRHEVESNAKQRVHYQKKYNDYQNKLSRLIKMRADEEITKDEFLLQKELLLKEQANMKERLEDSEGSAYGWLELVETFLNNAFQARDVIKEGNAEEKKDLIMAVGQNLFLSDGELEFSFKKPYDVLLKPKFRSNGLPG